MMDFLDSTSFYIMQRRIFCVAEIYQDIGLGYTSLITNPHLKGDDYGYHQSHRGRSNLTGR